MGQARPFPRRPPRRRPLGTEHPSGPGETLGQLPATRPWLLRLRSSTPKACSSSDSGSVRIRAAGQSEQAALTLRALHPSQDSTSSWRHRTRSRTGREPDVPQEMDRGGARGGALGKGGARGGTPASTRAAGRHHAPAPMDGSQENHGPEGQAPGSESRARGWAHSGKRVDRTALLLGVVALCPGPALVLQARAR